MTTTELRTRHLEEPTRDLLVRELWPDKALYASVMLFVTGFVGVLASLVEATVGMSYTSSAPRLFELWPGWLTLVLSLAASLAATLALARRSTAWAVRGCVLGFLSLGFLGVNSILSLIAALFVLQSWREGEGENGATRVLTSDMWPDKALAASLLLIIVGVVTTAWGTAIALDAVTYAGYFGDRFAFGMFATAVGLLALVAARRLYLQESPAFAFGVALFATTTVSLWIIGPVLAFAAVVLILLGLREAEFERPVV